MFYDKKHFPFTKALEDNWQVVLNEFEQLEDYELMDWYQRDLYENEKGWRVFPLFDWPSGKALNEAKCPKTSALIKEHIPHHQAVGYSILRGGTEIKPHTGYQGNFLRMHLGLRVPPEKADITVSGQTHAWKEGEVLIFDDSKEHSARNLSDQVRVVLIIDFDKPENHEALQLA